MNMCRICLKQQINVKFVPIYATNSKVALRIFLISGVQVSFVIIFVFLSKSWFIIF